ncbi:DUF6651 domain-containing protein [Rodentibacter haemolyticus]|uniref:DUF6651 domain-containing protein n=1 Tax=Rodentibacter haemolyticus TaxID=2778911 RepID=A0ABX6UW36_9PAST|nr:DUF6651 domain-containing protein [Rodentibacter haemolyticus]QPB42219.1 hypothetical protein IHV77_09950 [Rodentibacter haemolyticus]
MKLKLDENGNVVVQDGKPVYVYEDGKEVAYDVPAAAAKITALNAEAKTNRERAEKAEADLKAFDGVDVAAAKKALETVKNLDDKKLIDAGEAERVKAEVIKTYDEKLAAANGRAETLEQQLYAEIVGGAFARSKFITEKIILPADVAQAYFGKHFSVKDGKIEAKDSSGNPIYSRERAGELANFDEAMEVLINTYPNKDTILRGNGSSGSGSQGSPSQSGVPKSLADCKTDAEKIAYMQSQTAE